MSKRKQFSCLYVEDGRQTCGETFGCNGEGKIIMGYQTLHGLIPSKEDCKKYLMNTAIAYQRIWEGTEIWGKLK